MIRRVINQHKLPSDDGLIRYAGFRYTFHQTANYRLPYVDRRLTVYAREMPDEGHYIVPEKLSIYIKDVASDENFIGTASLQV